MYVWGIKNKIIQIKKSFVLSLASAGLILVSAFTVVNSAGTIGYSGSPYDGSDCGQCHSGGSAINTPSITASPAFGGSGTSLTYVPGTSYTITVQESGYPEFGFDVEILTSTSSVSVTPSGTLSAISANCKKSGKLPQIIHNMPISSTSNAMFQWIAPDSGTAYIFACINGVNGNGKSNGDKPKDVSYTLTVGAAGIHTNVAGYLITTYPNPAGDLLTINLKGLNGLKTIELYNISGDLLITQTTDDNILQLNLTSVANGTYFVKIVQERNIVASKMIMVSK